MSNPKESIYNEVFISYSRKNKGFVQKIVQAMYDSGRNNIWIDWEDIEYAEDWWQKIQAGIDSADNFIFILTPDSVQSEVCYKEVDHAVKAGKRIIPVEHIPITEKSDFEKMHPIISSHNWLPFKDGDNFQASMQLLFQTIDTDLVHVKLHTRFLVRAREWEMGDKNPSFLFRGDEIDGAEKWLADADAQDKSPAPTLLHLDYIAASREQDLEEKRRIRNLRITSMVAALISVIAIIFTVTAILSAMNARREVETANQAGTAIAQDQATVESQATFFAEQQEWVGELAQGGVIANPNSFAAVPEDFYATAAAVEALEAWSPVVQDINCVDDVCAEIVQVPAGCFFMGRIAVDASEPTFSICISTDYWIDRYAVSNTLFERLGGQASNPQGWESPDFPRTNVTWQEASDFCEMRGGRLASEPLWEYAARGPSAWAYPWGNEWNPDILAWGQDEPVAVDAYPEGASWVGAYNMSGNVWEWTSTVYGVDVDEDGSLNAMSEDIYYRYPYRPDDGREDRANNLSYMRTIRGGSYQFSSGSQHTGTRTWIHPELKQVLGQTVGFRCVFSASDPTILRLCGDNICDINENENICAGDCSERFTVDTETPTPEGSSTATPTSSPTPRTGPTCGNNLCEVGENSANCSTDCGLPTAVATSIPETTCGDGFCDAGENSANCSLDCELPDMTPTPFAPTDTPIPVPIATCGNGSCEVGENASNCSLDCVFPSATPIAAPNTPSPQPTSIPFSICGNNLCEVGENSGICPVDCTIPTATQAATCGNNLCEGGENSNNCSVDCGFPSATPIATTSP